MVDSDFFIQCLGFSQDPKTSNYIMVMEFAPLGSLYAYLNINLMIKCLDSDPNNRPSISEIEELIRKFYKLNDDKIRKQFEKAENYRKANPISIENNQQTTHPQAIYTS